jgi:hypothetical protein
MAVVPMTPFLAGVLRRRLHTLLPGFLKSPLIAGRIHDARRATPRQGRRDIREINGAAENKQRCG